MAKDTPGWGCDRHKAMPEQRPLGRGAGMRQGHWSLVDHKHCIASPRLQRSVQAGGPGLAELSKLERLRIET